MNNIPKIGDKIIDGKLVKQDQTLDFQTKAAEQLSNDTESENEIEKEDTKEYSIKQFRIDYKHILRRKIFSKLRPFEKERQKTLKLLLWLGIPLLITSTICLFILCNKASDFRLISVPFVLYFVIWQHFKKKLENKVKNNMMPLLMNAVPNFQWSLNTAISQDELVQVDIIPNLEHADFKSDDNFTGKYNDVDVIISEHEYNVGSGKNRRTVFKGAIIKIHMNKNFEGITLIRPKGIRSTAHRLEEVKLEDVEFSKKYQVFSDNQIEARYLITTSFMERFQNIKTAYEASEIYGAFYDNYIYIAPRCNKDLFSLAHLSKTLIDEEQYDVLFDEFASILTLVDHFKLNMKLGL